MSAPRLSAVFIVKNAAGTLREALASVAFCDETIVLDSGSSDATREIALACGAKVHERAFDDFASQKNHAVALASGDWVLSVDADEVVTPALADEIRAAVLPAGVLGGPQSPSATLAVRPTAYRLRRRTYFLGRPLRFGGHQSDRPVRLFRRDKGRFEGRVHEEVRADGPVGDLRAPLSHFSTATAGDYLKKLGHYTDLEAERMNDLGKSARPADLGLKPAGRFVQKYLFQLGILDGWGGFVYAALSAYYELVRQAKFWQKSKNYSANI